MSKVWPFPPQRKMKETTEWKTEVLRSRSAEQRICLRNTPRTSLEFDYQLLPQEIEAATTMARDWGADEFYIPFWHELTSIGTVTPGQASIPLDPSMRRYKQGGAAFIIGASGSYEVVTIASITGSTLELADPFVVKGHSGAVIMPCFLGRVKSPFSFRKYAAEYHTAEADFVLIEPFGITPANPYPSYKSSFVLSDRPLASGSQRESHTREFEGFSNLAGPLYYSTEFNYAVGTSTMSWSFDTLAQLWSFRQFMETVRGKQASFYLPRWTRDFVIDADALSTDDFLIVKENEYLTDTYTGPICISHSDGSQTYHTVTGWTYYAAGQYKMSLDAVLGQDITAASVELITRMPRMRFNSDNIEYNYEDGGVVDVRLPVMEVPD